MLQLHEMWETVAPAWGEHVAYADARGAGVAERMLALAAPQAGEDVLELACGPGGLGLAAAARGARVVLSDVAPGMTEIAAARAAELSLANVTTRVIDFERMDEPDERYDVVLCREGLMFATDPPRAVAEIRRVLRPGGRFAIAVWGPRRRNPWLGVVFDAAAEQLGRPVPPPGIPGPFSLSDAGRLSELLAAEVEEVSVPLRAATFEEWWERTSALAGPLTAILANLPPPAKAELEARVREAAAAYETADGLEFPGLSLVAAAVRPDRTAAR
jgi:SAM-dependent methyltransferase